MERDPRFYTGRDLGDETESGAEIMYRLMQAELRRLAGLEDSFDDSPTVNNYPDEINERNRDMSA